MFKKSRKIPIEVIVFLLFFTFTFSDSITTNLLIFRSCYITLGYNQSECELLGSDTSTNITEDLEKLAEPYAATISMVRHFSVGIINGIVCLFIGSWSDKSGRKPIMVTSIIGFVLQYFLQMVFTAFSDLSPWLIVIADVPVLLTGGFFSFLAMVFSYTSDLSTVENRGFKMSLIQAAVGLGPCIGSLLCSYVFYATNYFMIYLISFLMSLITLLLLLLFIPESIKTENEEKWVSNLTDLFEVQNLKDIFRTAFKRRANYDRFIILTSILISAIVLIVFMGQGAVFSFYLRAKFKWTLKQVSLYTSIQFVTGSIGIIVATTALQKYLKLPEACLILFALLTGLCAYILQGLASSNTGLYIAIGLSSFIGMVGIMAKSMLSKVIPVDEMGKLFSVITTTESVLAMSGAPIYTAIYNHTINNEPEVFNYVSAALLILEMILLATVVVPYHYKGERRKEFPEEQIESNERVRF